MEFATGRRSRARFGIDQAVLPGSKLYLSSSERVSIGTMRLVCKSWARVGGLHVEHLFARYRVTALPSTLVETFPQVHTLVLPNSFDSGRSLAAVAETLRLYRERRGTRPFYVKLSSGCFEQAKALRVHGAYVCTENNDVTDPFPGAGSCFCVGPMSESDLRPIVDANPYMGSSTQLYAVLAGDLPVRIVDHYIRSASVDLTAAPAPYATPLILFVCSATIDTFNVRMQALLDARFWKDGRLPSVEMSVYRLDALGIALARELRALVGAGRLRVTDRQISGADVTAQID
jgi:hypothetical protein